MDFANTSADLLRGFDRLIDIAVVTDLTNYIRS